MFLHIPEFPLGNSNSQLLFHGVFVSIYDFPTGNSASQWSLHLLLWTMNSQQANEIRNRHFTLYLGTFMASQQGIEIQFGGARIADRFRMHRKIANNSYMTVVPNEAG